MALPHSQSWQDWLTQAWNIVLGRKMQFPADEWLRGPIGEIGGVGEKVIAQIAQAERLSIDKEDAQAGLLAHRDAFASVAREIHPAIIDFYTATSKYDLEVWTKWHPVWGFFGRVVDRLFARRIEQLCLPADSLDTSRGISSEVISLRARDGTVRHRVWLRRLLSNGTVIYSGFYSQVKSPDGVPCVKVIFPLPKGSATVVLRIMALPGGRLRLASQGKKDGDAGFYFVVQDREGQLWRHYLRSFHEYIDVYVDERGTLRADHVMKLWGCPVYSLHYKIEKRISREPVEATRQTGFDQV